MYNFHRIHLEVDSEVKLYVAPSSKILSPCLTIFAAAYLGVSVAAIILIRGNCAPSAQRL